MVAPRLLSGPEPRYPAEAALERVGGTVLVRCTVTDKGTVEDCLVMKSVPLLDASVLSAVVARRYAPALFAGRPLSVRMVIPVRFVPP
jgi:TonB family protein